MKIYHMYRDKRGEAHAGVDSGGVAKPLRPRYDLANHSPDGFEWGYAGSGPAQLALALLADALGDDELAKQHYQHFKSSVVAVQSRRAGWKVSEADIKNWVTKDCR